ncbi:dUTP diphosphatase [Geofilum rubicundum]|uniref:Deoxyuridine 5'-triphosphate nucleotidohydrolase n=1 Tax=Geofilum rubicundum JCM 15548 TaxID=1236989 RepID=A0A0E9M1C6_9BACT|nr:dUTP diphosphatase [Geofilum rubicundum]GAO31299.1 deoxyuridine 5'-triphosphate nucleotidohydrolase [Geofilum rubicundum JCM 15548]
MLQIKVINRSTNPLPDFSTLHSAGVDIRASLEGSVNIGPLERVLIPTGLFMEIPEGYEVQIRPRSGLAIKNGIGVLNSPGTIDADYRGEVQVILVNLSNEPFEIKHGDRICQMILNKYERFEWVNVEVLSQTERGSGGFGHTGL